MEWVDDVLEVVKDMTDAEKNEFYRFYFTGETE